MRYVAGKDRKAFVADLKTIYQAPTLTKSSFPSPEAVRKLLYYLATVDITRKWTMPIRNWPLVLNQLVIPFEDRIDF